MPNNKTAENIEKQCCLCDRKYVGFGNNAEPLAKGRCCEMCNKKVIASRINKMMSEKLFGRH